MRVLSRIGGLVVSAIVISVGMTIGAANAFGVMSAGENPSVVQETTGVIRYTNESDGSFRGEEHWRIFVFPDGSRSLQIAVRLDAAQVTRTVVLRVDKEMRPLDAYQSLWANGQFRGSGYFWVDGGTLEARIMTAHGILDQKIEVPEHFSWVTHPVGADGLHMWYYDKKQGGVQSAVVYNTDTLGKTLGSVPGKVKAVDLKFIGNETIKVPAGEFRTEKYLMDGRLEIWVEPVDHIMVRMRNKTKDSLYELVEFEQLTID